MAKLVKKFIAANSVDESKIRLSNNAALKARNAADSADVDMIKVNASNKIEFPSMPITPSSAPAENYAVANKKYVDDAIAGLPSPMVYKGAFDASAEDFAAITNPQAGWLYKISVAGTVSAIEFKVGDNLIVNKAVAGHPVAADIDKIDNTDAIASVNGKTGTVVLDLDDINEKAESPSHLFFTATRAKAAAVSDSITDAVTDVAPSQNAVFDALAGKVSTSVTVNGHALSGNVSVTASDVSLGNVTNDAQLKAADLDTDNTMAANSDTKIPSQKAVKSHVASAISAIPAAASARFEDKTLLAGDISAGYIDLAMQASASASVRVVPVGGPEQEPGVDFTLSVVSSKTRITFAGDLATLLEANDKLMIFYMA